MEFQDIIALLSYGKHLPEGFLMRMKTTRLHHLQVFIYSKLEDPRKQQTLPQ